MTMLLLPPIYSWFFHGDVDQMLIWRLWSGSGDHLRPLPPQQGIFPPSPTKASPSTQAPLSPVTWQGEIHLIHWGFKRKITELNPMNSVFCVFSICHVWFTGRPFTCGSWTVGHLRSPMDQPWRNRLWQVMQAASKAPNGHGKWSHTVLGLQSWFQYDPNKSWIKKKRAGRCERALFC